MNGEPQSQAVDARILVVDDVEANVLVLKNLLRQEGYSNVHTTTDSHTVVDLHRASPFDLILLDLQMPRPDGLEIMAQLKPVPGADSALMRPLWLSMIFLQVASPTPVPSYLWRGCRRWKRSKITSARACSKPMPLSLTEKSQKSCSFEQVIRILGGSPP